MNKAGNEYDPGNERAIRPQEEKRHANNDAGDGSARASNAIWALFVRLARDFSFCIDDFIGNGVRGTMPQNRQKAGVNIRV